MQEFKVTVKSATESISYEVFKTLRGAKGLAKRVANEAFFGEEVEVTIEAL
jgi:hypothetical protein